MRKWTYPYFEVLVEQVRKKNEIFRNSGRAEIRKAELLIFGSNDRAELRKRRFRPLKILTEQSWCAKAELHIVGSQGRTEVLKRNFTFCFHKIGPIMMPKSIGYKNFTIFMICMCETRWPKQAWHFRTRRVRYTSRRQLLDHSRPKGNPSKSVPRKISICLPKRLSNIYWDMGPVQMLIVVWKTHNATW